MKQRTASPIKAPFKYLPPWFVKLTVCFLLPLLIPASLIAHAPEVMRDVSDLFKAIVRHDD